MGSIKSHHKIPEHLIISVFRYALGRRTYIVSETCDWLEKIWDDISPEFRTIICREIDESLHEDNTTREIHPNSPTMWRLGDNCDRGRWLQLRSLQ